MLLVKFQQNLTFFRRGGLGNPIFIIIGTRMTMGFKIQQNRTMNEKIDFFLSRKGRENPHLQI